jgi:hypothetical protein
MKPQILGIASIGFVLCAGAALAQIAHHHATGDPCITNIAGSDFPIWTNH